MTTHRITYDGNNVDIKVRYEGLNFQHIQKHSQHRSGSGKIETINQYGIHEIEITAIFSPAVYRQLFGWWAWARQGKEFSFTLDSTKNGNTTLDGSAAAGQKVIPITNMIPNGDMELDDSNWSDYCGDGCPTTNERSAEQAHGGTYSRKFIANGQYQGIWTNTITVIPSYWYNISFWLFGDDTNEVIGAVYEATDDTYHYFSGMVEANHYIPPDSWTQHSLDFQAVSTYVQFLVVSNGGETAGTHYVDDVSLMPLFSVGDYCLIRAEDNDDEFEIIEIDSISPGISITAVDNLIYSYTSDDTFRHWHHWPSVISLDDTFNPKLISPDYYEHTFRFAEKL